MEYSVSKSIPIYIHIQIHACGHAYLCIYLFVWVQLVFYRNYKWCAFLCNRLTASRSWHMESEHGRLSLEARMKSDHF